MALAQAWRCCVPRDLPLMHDCTDRAARCQFSLRKKILKSKPSSTNHCLHPIPPIKSPSRHDQVSWPLHCPSLTLTVAAASCPRRREYRTQLYVAPPLKSLWQGNSICSRHHKGGRHKMLIRMPKPAGAGVYGARQGQSLVRNMTSLPDPFVSRVGELVLFFFYVFVHARAVSS